MKQSISVHTQSTSTDRLFALILELDDSPRFITLKNWAAALAFACQENSLCLPYIIVVNTDSAMALGKLMHGYLNHNEVVVLDGIDLKDGDYIDIGKPLSSGSTIPVTVKSLVFANE